MEVYVGIFNFVDFSWQGLIMMLVVVVYICDLMCKQLDKKGLWLGIKISGCVGFGYVFEMIVELVFDDLFFEFDGVKLFVLLQVMLFIDGIELDYVWEGLNEIFKFYNLKVQYECGCGESFGVQVE